MQRIGLVNKPRIQFLSFPGCPNAADARRALQSALARTGLPAQYEEIDILAADTPASLRGWGSPTILVDGDDVAGSDRRKSGAACRIYDHGRFPSVAMITTAIEKALEYQ